MVEPTNMMINQCMCGTIGMITQSLQKPIYCNVVNIYMCFAFANWWLEVPSSAGTLWWHNSGCSVHDAAGTANHPSQQ